jgi:hypothetical protein
VGWDKGGRYYTRSVKVGGRVVREYIGGGFIGKAAALIDADRRVLRQEQAEARKQVRAELDALDSQVAELCRVADLLADAAMLAAGFRQHNRGEWRRKRVRAE